MSNIKVIELFAGVGGFRVALENTGDYEVVWSNQWEPSTKIQHASDIYVKQFGSTDHSNEDISKVDESSLPDFNMLVGGFPCQNYSVAVPLVRSHGIMGKKGVLWWDIHRILSAKLPSYILLENVDRLLKSPANQSGRDFAIILACLSDLGYSVEWRVINAAEYGFPQKRKRTFIFAYLKPKVDMVASVFETAFPSIQKVNTKEKEFDIIGELHEITQDFSFDFRNSGFFSNRKGVTRDVVPEYNGPFKTLGDYLQNEEDVPSKFFIDEDIVSRWAYLKGSKSEQRIDPKTGYSYLYKEGAMAFPDSPNKPARTIITSEGGSSPSRTTHLIKCPSGRYRRLTPIELERLNGFPDNHTEGCTDVKRGFLMGNALVIGVVELIVESILFNRISFD